MRGVSLIAGQLTGGCDERGDRIRGVALIAGRRVELPGRSLTGCSIRSVPTKSPPRSSEGRAVVALESTIFSHLGLPSPHNREALDRCVAAVRAGGGVPAVTAVLDGVVRLGLTDEEHERILGPARKAAERDVAVAVGQRWDFGATTVSASVAIAAAAGRVGVRHRRHRRGASRVGADGRHLGRPRRDRLAPGDHGVGRSQGVPRPPSNVGVPRDGRCAGARMAARLVPGVLHPLVRPARSPSGRVGRRGGPDLRRPEPTLVGDAADGSDSRGSRTRRRQPRPRAPGGARRVRTLPG